jgi:two-component system KDP operon response regulator KdpE
MDGMEVVAGLRGWTSVPIIVLSARDAQAQKVDALDIGADDYLTKPFGMDELLARMRASLRRSSGAADLPVLRLGEVEVDLAAKRVTREGAEVRLTPTEWHLLEALARRPGLLVPGTQLLTEIWGPQYVEDAHYLRVYMAQLRRKLERDPSHPRYLMTEPGMGYRFEP